MMVYLMLNKNYMIKTFVLGEKNDMINQKPEKDTMFDGNVSMCLCLYTTTIPWIGINGGRSKQTPCWWLRKFESRSCEHDSHKPGV